MKRNKLQNLIFNYINIKKINKFFFKKKVVKKSEKKRNALWIIIVIHSAIGVGEQ